MPQDLPVSLVHGGQTLVVGTQAVSVRFRASAAAPRPLPRTRLWGGHQIAPRPPKRRTARESRPQAPPRKPLTPKPPLGHLSAPSPHPRVKVHFRPEFTTTSLSQRLGGGHRIGLESWSVPPRSTLSQAQLPSSPLPCPKETVSHRPRASSDLDSSNQVHLTRSSISLFLLSHPSTSHKEKNW